MVLGARRAACMVRRSASRHRHPGSIALEESKEARKNQMSRILGALSFAKEDRLFAGAQPMDREQERDPDGERYAG